MKQRMKKKLALNKMTVSDLEKTFGGEEPPFTYYGRSYCICADTDLCGTSVGIFCEPTCEGATCSMANPCCL